MRKTVLFLAIIFSSITAVALAEKVGSLASDVVEGFGPNGCSKGMEPVHIWLTSPDGTETHFNIPKAYFSNNWAHSGGPQDILSLRLIRKTFEPACRSPLLYQNIDNNDVLAEILTSISIDNVGYPIDESDWSAYFDERYTNFVEKDENGFSVYEWKKTQDRDRGYAFYEYLVPPDGYFDKPTYVLCGNNNSPTGHYRRINCRAIQNSRPHLSVSYNFNAESLKDLGELDKKINKFLDQIIVENEEGKP